MINANDYRSFTDSEKPLFVRDSDVELINVKTSGITSENLFRTR